MKKQKKTAVIIGATGNLGRATCKTLKKAGFEIDPVWQSKDHPDATDPESYKNLPKKIDFAAYLAGVNVIEDTQNLSKQDWDRVIATNLTGVFLFAKAAFPALKAAKHSTFVAVSSMNVFHPYPGRVAYTASKAGIEGVIRSLAVEWAKYGIATHGLRLGHLEGLMKTTKMGPILLEAVKKQTPSHRLINPSEVAKYLVWVAEGGSQSISGSIIDFDPAYAINRYPI